jgi:hypothetical protein
MRPFADNSIFNTPLSPDAPLDLTSTVVVAALVAEAGKATINTTGWSVPVYIVPVNQATVKVTQSYPGGPSSLALQAAWDAVPLPANAIPAGPEGSDHHLVVWQPSTDRLWEFWHLQKTTAGWQAAWGGAIQDVSLSSGAYDATAWPGAKTNWGGSACSISIAAGLITLDDLYAGRIEHALALACPETRAKVWVPPAQRTDGASTAATSIPEGAHLRIDPDLDLLSLELPAFTLMLAEAAQTYGIVIRDTSSAVPFYAEDPSRLASNPYAGPTGFLEGRTPQQLLAAFPWEHLQLLQMTLS